MNTHHETASAIDCYMTGVGQRARAASRVIGRAETRIKNAALLAIAEALTAAEAALLAANQRDLDAGRTAGLEPALLDRLELTTKGVQAMAQGLREIAAQPDPVGEITDLKYRPSGIQVGKMRVPLGVIGIIYESTQCDRRRRRTVFESRQRGDFARRFRGAAFQPGHCRLHPAGSGHRRAACRCGASD